jgi:hypothetical protein
MIAKKPARGFDPRVETDFRIMLKPKSADDLVRCSTGSDERCRYLDRQQSAPVRLGGGLQAMAGSLAAVIGRNVSERDMIANSISPSCSWPSPLPPKT